MNDLTNAQFTDLKTLAKNQLISQVNIDMLDNEFLRVTIISQSDVDFDEVDKLIESIFPGKKYSGTVGDDSRCDFYLIDVDGETLIRLLMKKTDTWTMDEILRQEG